MKPETAVFLVALGALAWIMSKSADKAAALVGPTRYYVDPATGAGMYVKPGDTVYNRALDINWEQ